MFKPINKHIEIEPIKQETFISSQDSIYEEKGSVISIADDANQSPKYYNRISVGDIVYFDSWMIAKYQDISGKIRYLVPEDSIRAVETLSE